MPLRSCSGIPLAVGLAAAAGSLVAPVVARASGDDVAAAQVLFDDARRLMGQGRYAEACPKLEESQRIAPAIGTEFNLADCWEHVDRLASAWAAFLDVAQQTHARGEADRERVAHQRAGALEPRLARVIVQIAASHGTDGLAVRRDGEVVRPALWGIGVPVDAGDHRVEANEPARTAWSTSVQVQDGQTIIVAVPDLSPATSTPTSTSTSTDTHPISAPPPHESPSPDHTPAFVALGASVVLAGVGVLGIAEHDSDVNAYNADSTCPSIGSASLPAHCQDLVSSADTWKTLAIVGLVGAGAALATGAVLWLTAPTRATSGTLARVRCGVGPGSVDCAGTF